MTQLINSSTLRSQCALRVILLISSIGSTSTWASEEKGISWLEYQALLHDKHPKMQSYALDSEVSRQSRVTEQAGEAWELQLKAQQAHQEELLPSFGPAVIDQSLIGASLARPVWKTGAYVTIGAEGNISDNEYAGNNAGFPSPTESQAQEVSVTFSQPLLKNFKGTQSRLSADLSNISAHIAALQSEEQQEQFLALMLNHYLDWVIAREEQVINAERLGLAKRQSEEIAKRLEKNLVEKLDWLRTKDAESIAQQRFLLSRSKYRAKQKAIAELSNSPELEQMTPAFNLYDFPELPPLTDLLESTKASSRNILLIETQAEQLRRQLKSVEDNTRAELNLDFRTAYKNEDQSGLAAGQPDQDDGQDYSVGLNFKKQLGARAAKSNKKKLMFQLDQNALENKYAKLEISANIQDVYIQLKEMKNVLALNKALLETAEKTTQEEIRVYRQGRSDLTNVISSRDQLQNAKLQYAQNAISYHRLYLQLSALSDQLLATAIGK